MTRLREYNAREQKHAALEYQSGNDGLESTGHMQNVTTCQTHASLQRRLSTAANLFCTDS